MAWIWEQAWQEQSSRVAVTPAGAMLLNMPSLAYMVKFRQCILHLFPTRKFVVAQSIDSSSQLDSFPQYAAPLAIFLPGRILEGWGDEGEAWGSGELGATSANEGQGTGLSRSNCAPQNRQSALNTSNPHQRHTLTQPEKSSVTLHYPRTKKPD